MRIPDPDRLTPCVPQALRTQPWRSDAERGDDHTPTDFGAPKILIAAEIHGRSRLAGECGRSEPKASTDETGSPASPLLQIGDLH